MKIKNIKSLENIIKKDSLIESYVQKPEEEKPINKYSRLTNVTQEGLVTQITNYPKSRK